MLKKAIILSLALVSVIGISSVLGQAKINAAVASVGYGGSSGAVSVSYCNSVVYGDWKPCTNGWQYRDVLSQSPASCSLTASQQAVRSQACGSTPTTTVTPTTPGNSLGTIGTEADIVSSGNLQTILQAVSATANSASETASLTKYKKVLSQDGSISADLKTVINDFIVYGTPTTLKLGAGERAGVVNSFFEAYGKLPGATADWSDVIKIANGRWPGVTNATTENKAKVEFKKVYGRVPVMTNTNDSDAVTVIAYGLIPAQRLLASEKVAINTFRFYYRHAPSTALDWNVVRAIAYSGATR